ncbi:5-formyltetrahydrofolate cyclo-ligase [Specibacter cremeus]|uniref:5-formyltetrahydrofolate cyclo-ligase n=1 Tax=Specibacter cremeus TaxID=1629051 RepID=UPI000F7B6335|nr:5-formyltetrahydrofolate cyclo-ligase [Specibacter cremeus]
MGSPDKATWRERLRAARALMDDDDRRLAGDRLATAGLAWVADVSRPGRADDGWAVCCYLSAGTEPPTPALLAALVQAGYRVLVPVCEPGFQLSWARWFPGVRMARSPLAPVLEPVGPRFPFDAVGPVAGILLPALAVDLSGVRLGQGGGYYDRFLATAGTHPRAAVVHDTEVLPAGTLPHDALDRPVDYIVSPGGVRRIGGLDTPGGVGRK